MQTLLVNDVPQILNLGHAKSVFLQIGTQLVLSQALEDLSNMVELFFLDLAKIMMSSRYTTMNELVKGRKMSYINLMKFAGAFFTAQMA